MKIIIRKKCLGSAPYLLILSLLQPTAHAATVDNCGHSKLSTESTITTSPEPRTSHAQPIAQHWDYKSSNATQAQLNGYRIKQQITDTFTAYYKSAGRLEESYQDRVDQVLDLYEAEIDHARKSGDDSSITLAKQKADQKLLQLRHARDKQRSALQTKYNIS